MPANEDTFSRMVSLAVHDLRTPLATVLGFARTLQRTELGSPQDQYVGMIVAASEQLTEILDDLGTVARIESDRWEPNVQPVDTLELAQDAADGAEGLTVAGVGGAAHVDRDAAVRSIRSLARCALRHGGLDAVTIDVDGAVLSVHPVVPAAEPVLTLETMRDLGAAVAAHVVTALGGSLEVAGGRLLIRLPA